MAGRGNFGFQNNYPNRGHNGPYQNNQYANSNQYANNSQRGGAYPYPNQFVNNTRYGAYNAQDSMGTESRNTMNFSTPNAGNKIDYDMAITLARDYRNTNFEIMRNGEEPIPLHSLQVDQVSKFEDSYNIYMEAEQILNQNIAQQDGGPIPDMTSGAPVDMSELRSLITSIVREQIAEALQQASDSISIGSSANMSAKEHNQTWPPQQTSAQLGQTSATIPSDSQFIKPEP